MSASPPAEDTAVSDEDSVGPSSRSLERWVCDCEMMFGGSSCKQTTVSVLLRMMERESVADRAWTPVKFVCYSPQVMTIVLTALYAVFCVLYLAWRLVSLVAGEVGAWVGFALVVQRIASTVARFATYPGSFESVKLDVEREYGRRLAHRLENSACALEALWIDLHPRARVDIDKESFHRHVDDAQLAKDVILIPLLDAMRLIEEGEMRTDLGAPDWGSLSREAAEAFATVRKAIEGVIETSAGVDSAVERLLAVAPVDFSRVRKHVLDASVARCAYDLATACRELARAAQLVLPHQRHGDSPRGILSDAAAAIRGALRAPCPKPLDSAFGLAMLRAELHRSYGANQLWVKSKDGTKIDCCIIPPYFRRAPTNRNVPTVLFCAPNAVVYESFGMAPRDGLGWVATYARMGLQVVVWNLRGYGRTKGSPSPRKNGSDAVAVAEYLRGELGVPRLLVHGESIGGMAATHLAFHAPEAVTALVADRTFANLPVEAQYLTGVRAAAAALPFATCWLSRDSDSLKHFVGAKCPKLVATDACDHMIPDQASLKAGVALFAELGDASPRRSDLPRELAIADASGRPPTPTLRKDLVPDPSTSWRLSDASIAHFTACARHVARAAHARRATVATTTDHEPQTHKPKVRIPLFGPAARRRSRTRASTGSSSMTKGAAPKRRQGGSLPPPRSPPRSDDDDDDDEDVADEDEAAAAALLSSSPSSPSVASGAELDVLAWRVLENVDGGCGQALGRALAMDLGAVRAWVASYATWPNGVANKLIDGVVDVWGTDDDQPATSGSEDVEDEDPENPPENAAPLGVRAAAIALDRLLAAEHTQLAAASAALKAKRQPLIDAVDFVGRFLRALADRADYNAAHADDDDRAASLGTLLVLGCGHNAPYAARERDAFFKWLHPNFLDPPSEDA